MKLKLFVCLIKHCATNIYGLNVVLTSTLDGGKIRFTSPRLFLWETTPQYLLNEDWTEFGPTVDHVRKRNILLLPGIEHGFLSRRARRLVTLFIDLSWTNRKRKLRLVRFLWPHVLFLAPPQGNFISWAIVSPWMTLSQGLCAQQLFTLSLMPSIR
jgi:hypothetical protein